VSAGTAVALQPSIIEIPLRGCRLARFRSPLFVVQCPRGIQTHPYGASARLPFTFHCPPGIPCLARFPLSPVRPPKVSGGRGQPEKAPLALRTHNAQRTTAEKVSGVAAQVSDGPASAPLWLFARHRPSSSPLPLCVKNRARGASGYSPFSVQCSLAIALFSIHPPAAVAFLPPLDHHADGRSQR